jgi:hypothetical protein
LFGGAAAAAAALLLLGALDAMLVDRIALSPSN